MCISAFLLTPANVDYNALSVDLTFNADTNRSCDSLTVTADSLVEGEETLTIRLTTSDSAVTLNPAESTVTIVEEDSKCSFTGVV